MNIADTPRPLLDMPPSTEDIALAIQVLARHVPERSDGAVRCRDCRWPHPCATNRLATAVFLRAGIIDHAVRLPPIGHPDQG